MRIKVVTDYATRGYASAAARIKPFIVLVDGRKLLDKKERVRRFSTAAAARRAGERH